jgi:hypothetical protein
MTANQLKQRLRYLNPVALEEISRGLTGTARRFLEYERFVETLELTKAQGTRLPPAVERRIGSSMQVVLGDIRTAAQLTDELADQLDEAEVIEPLFRVVARDIERTGPVSVASILERGKETLESEMERRGMPRELWGWALSHTPGLEISICASKGTIEARRGDVVLFSFPNELAVEPMAVLAGFRAKIRRTNSTSILRAYMQKAVSLYEARASDTALHGIRVFPTGIPPVIIFLIVVVVIAIATFVTGVVLTVLCATGVITDRETCAIAPLLILVGFLILVGAGLLGIANEKKEGGEDRDPDPDPPG